MYFWNSYPFIRFSLVLILGIVCFDAFPAIWVNDGYVLLAGFITLSLFVLISEKFSFYQFRHLNGILALFLIFIIGGTVTKYKYHDHNENHYLNNSQDNSGFIGTVISPKNERTNHFRYDLELEAIVNDEKNYVPITGTIHIYIRKDSLNQPIRYGDKLAVHGRFYPVPGPDNPNEFNYRKYLEQQNIYAHSFVKEQDVKIVSHGTPNIFLSWAFRLRASSASIIDKNIKAKRERGIAKALLIGIKDHLDNDIKKAYSSAGAMHVLAVSGLHVGIIFLLIQLLFGRLRNIGRSGKYGFAFISVITIWLYACMAGLSPSVLRAATMFSFISLGQIATREGNIYNTLGFAAFVLLLINPYLIYSVGFQLSFAAVIGIVYLQPKFYQLLNFKSWLLDKAWAITCVSIAAQLATFPLAAYYFHQFPTYFLASNLIVIPSSFLMLIGGIGMIIIDPIFPIVGELIGQGLESFIWFINEIISYVHVLPNSLIEWIYLDKHGLILTYLIVITLFAGLHYRSFKTLVISSFLGLLFIFSINISHGSQAKRHELLFYEISDKTAIDYINGHSSELYIDLETNDDLELLSFQIDPHRLASHLRPIEETLINTDSAFIKNDAIRTGVIANKRILIFDSTTFHLDFTKKMESDLIIIENQSVKSLNWLSDSFDFEMVIIGNRNSGYYSKKIKSQAEALGLRIHSLKEDGALRIPIGIKKERTLLPALFTTNPD
ncbi:ComEC/Rec2 family competence protein [Ekhidna sp.]|uniref:ComEC/Rec2 family competence protein n=1 Tax=Ekhidna sp. TaxID=2608089 RepID=UPI003B51109A